ncbi:MAG: type II toxin-antitoxin system PemK/MazF family toxin [Cyanobacteria bacterium J06621_8]
MSDYRHGTIWSINFEPQVGSEINKVRPGLIISKTGFNLRRRKITVIPFSSQIKPSGGAARVFVPKSSDNGLSKDSELIVIDPATFDKKRFINYIGALEEKLLQEVKRKLAIYLDLI